MRNLCLENGGIHLELRYWAGYPCTSGARDYTNSLRGGLVLLFSQ